MKVHYTGRQVEITPAIQSRVEQKLQKIHKILGSRLDLEAHVILSLERHRYTTEVTLHLRGIVYRTEDEVFPRHLGRGGVSGVRRPGQGPVRVRDLRQE